MKHSSEEKYLSCMLAYNLADSIDANVAKMIEVAICNIKRPGQSLRQLCECYWRHNNSL